MKKRFDWDCRLTVPANAAAGLPVLARRYFEAGRALQNGEPSDKDFHGFRLETKRFRYVLEVFEPVFPGALEDRLKSLKQIQTWLGDMNDAATILALLANHDLRRHKSLHSSLEAALKEKRTGFLEYWKTTFDAPGQEDAWIATLSAPAGLQSSRKPATRVSRPRTAAAKRA